MAFYTMFLMTGGMVVPYVWGLLFLNEPLSALRLIGLLIIVVAIVLSNYSVAKSSPKTIALCAVALLVSKRKETSEKDEGLDFKKVFPIIVCSAVVSGVSYMFQLIGASNLPATVLYPIVSGGSIIFSTLAGILCFKEKPNVYQTIGVVLCFVGTCLFL